MSTYFAIEGTVTLDATAWEALGRTATGYWVCEETEGVTVTEGADGSTVVRFDETFRNLGRYLEADLALANLVGDVVGDVTVVCTDGANLVTATSYQGRTVQFHGTSECLAVEAVQAPQTVPATWGFGTYEFMLLAPVGGGADDRLVATSIRWPEDCGCGGWDEENEVPVCAGDTGSGVGQAPLDGVGRRMAEVAAGGVARPGEDHDAVVAAAVAGGQDVPWRRDETVVVTWVRAVLGREVPTEAATIMVGRCPTSDMAEEVVRCVLANGVTRPGALAAREVLEALGSGVVAPRTVLCAAAAHPALDWDLAVALELHTVAVAALAANRVIGDEAMALPGTTVANSAMWRFGDDELVHGCVEVLAPNWRGTAAELCAAAHVAVTDHTAVSQAR